MRLIEETHTWSDVEVSENVRKLTCTCGATLVATSAEQGRSYHLEFSGDGNAPFCAELFGRLAGLLHSAHALRVIT